MLFALQRSAENDITLEALPTVEGAQVGVVLFRPGNQAIEGILCYLIIVPLHSLFVMYQQVATSRGVALAQLAPVRSNQLH